MFLFVCFCFLNVQSVTRISCIISRAVLSNLRLRQLTHRSIKVSVCPWTSSVRRCSPRRRTSWRRVLSRSCRSRCRTHRCRRPHTRYVLLICEALSFECCEFFFVCIERQGSDSGEIIFTVSSESLSFPEPISMYSSAILAHFLELLRNRISKLCTFCLLASCTKYY